MKRTRLSFALLASVFFALNFSACKELEDFLESQNVQNTENNNEKNNESDSNSQSGTNQNLNPIKTQSFSGLRQVKFSTPSDTNGIQFQPQKQTVQRADYSAIDEYAKNLSINTSTSISDAAKLVTATSVSDNEKARAIFTWIAYKVAYDCDAAGNSSISEAYTAEGAFSRRKAVCQGYALLYQEMGKAVGLDVDYVSGFDKRDSYVIGNSTGNHGWNYIKSASGDMLVDVTWGAGNTINNTFTQKFKDYWFDVGPAYMILSHYPKDARYQNLSSSLTDKQFLQLPRVEPSFEKLGIDGAELLEFLYSHTRAWAPLPYGYLGTLENGRVKAVNIPMTDYLSESSCIFNFTDSNGSSLFLKTPSSQIINAASSSVQITASMIGAGGNAPIFHNGNGLLYYKMASGKESTGSKRIDISTLNPQGLNDSGLSGETASFVPVIYYYDDNFELISDLQYHGARYNTGAWVLMLSGSFIEVYPSGVETVSMNRCAYYDLGLQWWMQRDEAFTGKPDIIKSVFSKIDDSIDLSRDAPDYATNFNISLVPLSKKEELTPKIEAFKDYDWQKDDEFRDFVVWMRNHGIPESTVQFYIDMAHYPSQRGFYELGLDSNLVIGDISWHGVDGYYVKTLNNYAGGMERYLFTRKLCDHSLWQQDVIPALFVHYVDSEGSAVSFTPRKDVSAIIDDLENLFASFMPNQLKIYQAELPIKYSDGSFVNGTTLLEALKVSAPSVYESVKDKKFAVLNWYDDDRVGNSELLKNSSIGCLPWKLFCDLYRDGDLMHLQHGDLFTSDNSKRPSCLANDCQHASEICPLCLYALGY